MDTERPAPILVADHPALDFLNSIASPSGTRIEWLGSGAGLLDWLERAGLVPEEAVACWRGAPSALDATAEAARELREWLRGFVASHAGRRLSAAAIEALRPLNALLGYDRSHWLVQAEQAALAWRRQRSWSTPESLLQPVAEAIGHLVCEVDFTTVRHCEGTGCTLWFRDTSSRQTRRWCSMAICGNRHKAAAHRARVRASQAG